MTSSTRTQGTPTDLDELGFLSDAALMLAEQSFSEHDVFRLVTEQLASITPDSVVAASRFVPSIDSTVVEAYAGPPHLLEAAREAIGELIGLTFRVSEEARRGLSEAKLIRLDGGLGQLVFRAWPLERTRMLEAKLGIQSVHAQAFARKGDFLGTVSIISRAPRLEHARICEAFIRFAAVVIQRIRLEARVRDSEQRLRLLTDNSPDVIFRLRLKPTRSFEYVSPAAQHVARFSAEELYADADLGAACLYPENWKLAPPRDVPSEPVIKRCDRGDGSYSWTEQKLRPIRDEAGDIAAIEGIVRDITTRKDAEDALVEADRRKDEFLAVLSHELRNPLAPIRNSLYILERTDAGTDQAKRARAVIERQVDHMTRLTDDLLDVTRITHGKIQLQRQPVDLNQLVRTTVEDHRSIFVAGQIELDVALANNEIWIDADPTRIAQIVGNLLLNAAKFTPAGGRTTVSVTTDPATAEAVVRVRDTGVGITPELLPHVFEPFLQADTTIARSKGGLGLGLMLAKGLVELHGGTVAVESQGLGKGAELTVRLPLEPATSHVDVAKPDANGGRVRVLVIEDNIDAADSLRDVLELRHHTVEVAYSGPDGVARARTFHPDVVLCDIGLPGMDGYAVAHAIRELPELDAVGLVALTGYASADDVSRAKSAGFDRHLPKPPKLDVLEGVITQLVQSARSLPSR